MYRFGHSMLTETVDRIKPNGRPADISLFNAFLNPTAFNDGGALTAEQAAGDVVRGMTKQTSNEIDEFVTGALRNNLLGLPLDLATHQHRAWSRHRHGDAERGPRGVPDWRRTPAGPSSARTCAIRAPW